MIIVLGLLAVAAAACVLTWLIRRLLVKLAMLDVPNERSSHELPTPRGGGIAIVFTVVAAWFLAVVYGLVVPQQVVLVAGGGLLVAAVGLADDRSDVPAVWRLLVHLIAAALLVAATGGIGSLSVGVADLELGWIGAIIAVLYIVWLLNLYNFMDGIDGIAGIEAVTVAAAASALLWITGSTDLAVMTAALGAASLGFLVWNWPPASIFMGDIGSSFLGFTFAALAVLSHENSGPDIYVWSILLGVFIVDATVTLLRRILRRDRFYEAHRSHAYQHAAMKYGSHARISIAVGVLNVGWLFPIALLVTLGMLDGFYGIIIAYVPLLWISMVFKAGGKDELFDQG